MWQHTYSKTVSGISAAELWAVWTDVNQWHTWQPDIDSATLEGGFTVGNVLRFKPKGGPLIPIRLVTVEPERLFVDLTQFPGAQMLDDHEIIPHGEGLEIKTTIRLKGPLEWLWLRLVVNDIVRGLPAQTDQLIARVHRVREQRSST
jgi:hypothetical protein